MKSFNGLEMKGRLYNYELEERDGERGPVIVGSLFMEVSKDGDIVELRYYASETFSSGKVNRTYGILENIMAGNVKTVMDDGDEAEWFSMAGSIDVSYFKPRDGKCESVDDLARNQSFRGSFINPNRKKEYLNRWCTDLYVVKVQDVEADEDRGTDRFVRVYGYIVDEYNEMLKEVVFEARTPAAMNFFLSLPVSNEAPYAANAWGGLKTFYQKSVKKNSFGEDEVKEYESKKWVLVGMNPDAYTMGDEAVMTAEQWTNLLKGLEEHKAEIFNKAEEGAAKPKLAF